MPPNNIQAIYYEEYGIKMVALYNANLNNYKEIEYDFLSGEYNKNIVIMTEEQFNTIFKDLIKKGEKNYD